MRSVEVSDERERAEVRQALTTGQPALVRRPRCCCGRACARAARAAGEPLASRRRQRRARSGGSTSRRARARAACSLVGWIVVASSMAVQRSAAGRWRLGPRRRRWPRRSPAPTRPSAAYLTDATLNALIGELRGASGKLRVEDQSRRARRSTRIRSPKAPTLRVEAAERRAARTRRRARESGGSPSRSARRIKPISDFSLIAVHPRSREAERAASACTTSATGRARRAATSRRRRRRRPTRYLPPSGFIEVTQQNADTRVSEHFQAARLPHARSAERVAQVPRARDAERGQAGARAAATSRSAASTCRGVTVMSGFRTPQYNEGGGDPRGPRRPEPAHVRRRGGHLHRQQSQRRDGRPQSRREDQHRATAGSMQQARGPGGGGASRAGRGCRRLSGCVWARTFHTHRLASSAA